MQTCPNLPGCHGPWVPFTTLPSPWWCHSDHVKSRHRGYLNHLLTAQTLPCCILILSHDATLKTMLPKSAFQLSTAPYESWVCYNHSLDLMWQDDAPELSADYSPPPHLSCDLFQRLSPSRRPPFTWLFLGPAGAETRLHVDVWETDAWLAQLQGRKRFVLYHPSHR
jgi:hypothetical protein